AYGLWQCDEDARGLILRQALEIRRRNCDPVTVFRGNSERLPDTTPGGGCQTIGHYRAGLTSPILGGVQRLGVRPDGSGLVFEVSNVSPFPLIALTPEQQGFFFVRADGSGLRRLGPASRDPCSRTVPYSLGPTGVSFFASCGGLSFSPDGRSVVFTDLGPGPDGEMAVQVVTLAVTGKRAGKRRQVSRPPLARAFLRLPPALPPASLDDETIGSYSFANPEGLNPQGQLTAFTVRTDGTGLRTLPAPVVLQGSQVVTNFAVAGGRASLATLACPVSTCGPPVNPIPGVSSPAALINEVFLVSGRDLLQLTNFRRADTSGLFVDVNRRRAFFIASADPLGRNRSQNCQIFSIDTFGAHLRQVTHFREGDHAVNGCLGGPPPDGCGIGEYLIDQLGQAAREDPATGTIVFNSQCDPFGTNPFGLQVFAVRPDGSHIRALTHAKGFVSHPDGSVAVELVGPWDYAPSVR